jgi:hypothetical protein
MTIILTVGWRCKLPAARGVLEFRLQAAAVGGIAGIDRLKPELQP